MKENPSLQKIHNWLGIAGSICSIIGLIIAIVEKLLLPAIGLVVFFIALIISIYIKGIRIKLIAFSLSVFAWIIIFLALPIIEHQQLIYQVGPYFVSISQSESEKDGFVFVEKGERFVLEEKFEPSLKIPQKLEIQATAGLWSQVEETAHVKLQFHSEKSCQEVADLTFTTQIPQENAQNYGNEKLMEKKDVLIDWNCFETVKMAVISITPGSWALSVGSIKVFSNYKISAIEFLKKYFSLGR